MSRPRIFSRTGSATLIATIGLLVGGGGVALAGPQAPARQQAAASHGGFEGGGAPTDIPNLGLVKNKIKAYYGDIGESDSNATRDSYYDGDVYRQLQRAEKAFPRLLRDADAKPAVVVDVDDTTLLTYRYEATHDFGYDPAENAAYIHEVGMPPVFGMPDALQHAATKAEVYYLTGRPETQRADTLRDLKRAGYPDVVTGHLFMRNKANPPTYLSCEPTCTTVQYKSGTRKHIETLNGGQDILINAGDQYSDLKGGYADMTIKLPNPMYFLP